jgi:hypothetical protein
MGPRPVPLKPATVFEYMFATAAGTDVLTWPAIAARLRHDEARCGAISVRFLQSPLW